MATTQKLKDTQDNSIKKEKELQEKLDKSFNEFQHGKIISSYILEAKIDAVGYEFKPYDTHRVINIDGHKHLAKITSDNMEDKNLILQTINSSRKKGSVDLSREVFVVAYKIEFEGMETIVTSTAYYEKENAEEEIKNMKENFEFISRNIPTEKLPEDSADNTYLLRTSENRNPIYRFFQKLTEKPIGAATLILFMPTILSIIGSGYVTTSILELTLPLSLLSFVIVFSFIYASIFMCVLVLPKVKSYSQLNLSEYRVTELNLYDPHNTKEENNDYKSVTCEVNRSKEGVTIKTNDEDMNCEWEFERKNSGQLCKEGKKFVMNYPGEGEKIAVTIEKATDEDELFISNCGSWKIKGDFLND